MTYYTRWRLHPEATRKLNMLIAPQAPHIEAVVLACEEPLTTRSPAQETPARWTTCACGIASTYLGGNPASHMSYVCPACQYCITNCDCPNAPQSTRPRTLPTLPPGLGWHLWNYGLFGDERASKVQDICLVPGQGYVLGSLHTYEQLQAFAVMHHALSVDVLNRVCDEGVLAGHIQLPTTYSTCGYDNATRHEALMQDALMWESIWNLYQEYHT